MAAADKRIPNLFNDGMQLSSSEELHCERVAWRRQAPREHGKSAAERASALARALRTLLRFINAQWATAHVEAIQRLDRRQSFILGHVHEAEPARAARLTIVDELDRFHLAVLFEHGANVLLRGVEWEIPDVYGRHPKTRL
jgi:hypothetical protein